MIAVSPVMPGEDFPEVVIAKNQDEYLNLPAIDCGGGTILTRFELSAEELETIQKTKSVWLFMHTFGQPIQPIALQVEQPQTEAKQPELSDQPFDSFCAIRYSEETAIKAKSLGIEIETGICAQCGAKVIFSKVSQQTMEAGKIEKIICLECFSKLKTEGAGNDYITPETAAELAQVQARNENLN